MASSTRSLETHEIDFLKETLQAQQDLLQKLYNELDAERESSAIAAEETMSMILRLQGEKAAMELETSQYKRMVEEKMCHVEETLEVFQELIYQKDVQIASLELQVQSYENKLGSIGCDSLASSENMMSRRNSDQGSNGTLRRGDSLPLPVNIALSRRASTEASPKILMENRRENNSYWEEIKKLDERVKGYDSNDLNGSPRLERADDVSDSNLLKPSESTSAMHDYSRDIFVVEVPECFDRKALNGKLDGIEQHDQEKQSLIYPDSDFYSPNVKDIDEKFDGNTEKQIEELHRRLKQLEVDRFADKDYEKNFETGDDEFKTLTEVMEKVKAMQSEITSLKTTKPLLPENRSFGCFKEVLFCFLP